MGKIVMFADGPILSRFRQTKYLCNREIKYYSLIKFIRVGVEGFARETPVPGKRVKGDNSV